MMKDVTWGWLADAPGFRGFDHRLKVKNLLEKKLRINTALAAHGVLLLLAEVECKSEVFLGWVHTVKKNLTCFHCGLETS